MLTLKNSIIWLSLIKRCYTFIYYALPHASTMIDPHPSTSCGALRMHVARGCEPEVHLRQWQADPHKRGPCWLQRGMRTGHCLQVSLIWCVQHLLLFVWQGQELCFTHHACVIHLLREGLLRSVKVESSFELNVGNLSPQAAWEPSYKITVFHKIHY